MNGAHWHLLINHIPVLGVPFGVGLLLVSLWRMNWTLQRAGMVVLLLSGIAAETADYTGDGAKRVLRQEMGAQYPRDAVRAHEDAAGYGLTTAGILAGIALVGLWFARHKPLPRGVMIGIVVAGLFVTVVLARVADLGGQIRHVEIRSGQPPDSLIRATPPGG
jgi:uncharacterized membrane protein YiaA